MRAVDTNVLVRERHLLEIGKEHYSLVRDTIVEQINV